MLVREFEKREAALNSTLQERMLEDAEGQLTVSVLRRISEMLEFNIVSYVAQMPS